MDLGKIFLNFVQTIAFMVENYGRCVYNSSAMFLKNFYLRLVIFG